MGVVLATKMNSMPLSRLRTRWLDLNYLLLFLLLLSGSATTLRAAEPLASESRLVEKKEQQHRFLGVWALVDHANNLFNVRLSPNGRAISTSGPHGAPLGGSLHRSANQLFEHGRWHPWGNGVRIDYTDGWSDALLIGPEGLLQWSWAPGASRLSPPSNHGKAVRVKGVMAEAVGVYQIQPAQANLPVTTVSLMSNGLAFNAIDQLAGGTWRLEEGQVVITWSSGWRTQFEPKPRGRLEVKIWEPASRPPSQPTAIRPGYRQDAVAP